MSAGKHNGISPALLPSTETQLATTHNKNTTPNILGLGIEDKTSPWSTQLIEATIKS